MGTAAAGRSVLAGDAVAEKVQHPWVGAGELADLLAAVATQQCDSHRGVGTSDYPPHRTGLLPSPKFGHAVDVHRSTMSPKIRRVQGGLAVAAAATFVWLGMVLAISFLEAPLKFRAPGVTLQIGLGIGRLVFRALNICEAALAATAIVAAWRGDGSPAAVVSLATAAALLVSQLLLVRPALTRRSDQVLAGADGPRSPAHYVYVALELVKVIALVAAGVVLLM